MAAVFFRACSVSISYRFGRLKVAQHSVHPTGGTRRVFKQFAWLRAGSAKVELPRPAHPRVTPAVETVEKVGKQLAQCHMVLYTYR